VDQGAVLDLARQGIETALLVCLPMMAVALFIGVLVSVFQAVTSVQEMTLTFVPKLIGVGVVIAFLGNWMLTTLVNYMLVCFDQIARIAQ
jgi:flagellar biosynthetic protein FliQ